MEDGDHLGPADGPAGGEAPLAGARHDALGADVVGVGPGPVAQAHVLEEGVVRLKGGLREGVPPHGPDLVDGPVGQGGAPGGPHPVGGGGGEGGEEDGVLGVLGDGVAVRGGAGGHGEDLVGGDLSVFQGEVGPLVGPAAAVEAVEPRPAGAGGVAVRRAVGAGVTGVLEAGGGGGVDVGGLVGGGGGVVPGQELGDAVAVHVVEGEGRGLVGPGLAGPAVAVLQHEGPAGGGPGRGTGLGGLRRGGGRQGDRHGQGQEETDELLFHDAPPFGEDARDSRGKIRGKRQVDPLVRPIISSGAGFAFYSFVTFCYGNKKPGREDRPGRVAGLGFLAIQQLIQLIHKRIDILELPVHRREADVGHLVQVPEALHDQLPDAGGADLPPQLVLELLLDLVGGPLQQGEGDRPLLAGLEHAAQELAPVKGLPGAALLDDHQGEHLHGLVGGEAILAFQALPPPADAGAVVGGAGVDDLAVQGGAEWAFHISSPPPSWVGTYI